MKQKNNLQMCQDTLELHNFLLTDLKKRADEASKVLLELGLEAELFAEEKKRLKKKAKKAGWWAAGLAFVPYVNMVATPVLGVWALSMKKDATSAGKKSLLVVEAADCIKDSLIQSIENLTESMSKIAGFFQVLSSDLTMLNKDQSDKPKILYYKRIKKKSEDIVGSCHSFISTIPECKANFDAIPDNYDRNYVQGWLSKKQAEAIIE